MWNSHDHKNNSKIYKLIKSCQLLTNQIAVSSLLYVTAADKRISSPLVCDKLLSVRLRFDRCAESYW